MFYLRSKKKNDQQFGNSCILWCLQSGCIFVMPEDNFIQWDWLFFFKNNPEHNFSFYYYYNLKYFYSLITFCFIRKIICFLNKFKKYNLNEKIRKCFLSLSACPRCISAAHRRNVRPFNSVCQKKNRVSSSLVSHSLKDV